MPAVVVVSSAYADIAQNLAEAGYSNADIATLTAETEFYSDTRAAIKKHSGEELDIKPYEADMRHLINTYTGLSTWITHRRRKQRNGRTAGAST